MEVNVCKTPAEAIRHISKYYSEIINSSHEPPMGERKVDWGTPKGQGKRSGYMVKGGMGGAPKGVKTYHYIDLSRYADDFKQGYPLKYLEDYQKIIYFKAREMGFNHIESLAAAIKQGKL